MKKTLLIAEIGVNHNADLDLAVRMIRAAAASGADVIKFQTAVPELVQTRSAPKAHYQKVTTGVGETQLEMSRKLHFALDVFGRLKGEVESTGREFLSTAFDLVSLAHLSRLGMRRYKVPSGEITNLPYLRKVAEYADSVLLSTGMAAFDEVAKALDVLLAGGVSRDRVTVLQCNTEYPTPFADVNLLAMPEMGRRLGVAYGYSDHTQGVEAAIAAVALGACVIEKHFTTSNDLPGPDQRASLEPGRFAEMVQAIRNVEVALGSTEKGPTASEAKNKLIARRSLFAATDLPAGTVLTAENIAVLRPEIGVSPMRYDEFLGRRLRRDVPAQSPLSFDDLD